MMKEANDRYAEVKPGQLGTKVETPALQVTADGPVIAAVVRFGGKLFEDVNHDAALRKALDAKAVPMDENGKVQLGPEDSMNLFRLKKNGEIVSSDIAQREVDRAKPSNEAAEVLGRPVEYGEFSSQSPTAQELDYQQYTINFKNR